MINVYVIDIRELEADRSLESHLEMLSDVMARDVLSYNKTADRLRVLAGKLLLRHAMILEKTGGGLDMIREEEKGRLIIPGSDFDFNISHSGNYTVLATTFDGPCGIDIEMHRELDIEPFRRLFTDGEWEAITGAEDPRKIFFTCWAIKESVIKADGRGVAVLSATEIHSHHHAICDEKTWYIHALDIAEGYASYAAYHRPFEKEPEIIWISAPVLRAAR